jgi:hypothetical protein
MVLAQDIVNGFDRVGTSRRVQKDVSMKIMRAYAECDNGSTAYLGSLERNKTVVW